MIVPESLILSMRIAGIHHDVGTYTHRRIETGPSATAPMHDFDVASARRAADEDRFLVRYERGKLVVTDENHRHAAFVLRGHETCWAILSYPNPAEHRHHEARGFRVGHREAAER